MYCQQACCIASMAGAVHLDTCIFMCSFSSPDVLPAWLALLTCTHDVFSCVLLLHQMYCQHGLRLSLVHMCVACVLVISRMHQNSTRPLRHINRLTFEGAGLRDRP